MALVGARVSEVAAAAKGMYYLHLLDIGVTWPYAWSKGLDWDAWSTDFSTQAETIAAAAVPMRAADPYLLAWQTDNEINWNKLGLDTYLNQYSAGPGGSVAIAWLQTRYANTLPSLCTSWNIYVTQWTQIGAAIAGSGLNTTAFGADDADFLGVVADRYFNITTGAIRRYDTNHLISGVRFAVSTVQIVTAAAKYCDIIDQHDYSDLPNMDWLATLHNVTGKPIVLGEFSFTAADSNLPNTVGARAGRPETTQTARTAKYYAYAQELMVSPFVIGYGWWNFVDEPSTGRWPDGEDSNYGLVSLADDPYSILTTRMTAAHAAMQTWHAQGHTDGADSEL